MANIWEHIRPSERPRGGTEHDLIGDGSGGPSPILKPSEVRPIEAMVIDAAARLGSLVVPITDSEVIKNPDDVKSRHDWISELIWNAMVDDIYSIVAIKWGGEDKHYLVKPDGLKADKKHAPTKYFYTRFEETFEADPKDVLQFRYRGQVQKTVATVREAEDAFWARYKKIGYNSGVLEPTNYVGPDLETEDKTVNKLMNSLMRNFVARVPRGSKFVDLSPKDDIEKNFETIVRAWCFNYRVPTSLFNLDLPSHSVPNIGASYGHFIRQCLKPLLLPVYVVLAWRNDTTVELDFKHVERGSILETGDGMMKLAQTGIYTINELRMSEGYPKREDGDVYPNAAGAPETKNAGTNTGNE